MVTSHLTESFQLIVEVPQYMMTEPDLPKNEPAQARVHSRTLWISYALLIVLGGLGAHRYYHGYVLSGLGMLGLTAASLALSHHPIAFAINAGLIAWMVFDAFMIPRWTREKNA